MLERYRGEIHPCEKEKILLNGGVMTKRGTRRAIPRDQIKPGCYWAFGHHQDGHPHMVEVFKVTEFDLTLLSPGLWVFWNVTGSYLPLDHFVFVEHIPNSKIYCLDIVKEDMDIWGEDGKRIGTYRMKIDCSGNYVMVVCPCGHKFNHDGAFQWLRCPACYKTEMLIAALKNS